MVKPVLAAGAVVTRVDPTRGTEVVVIHRQKYRDWTLPKGKVEAGESVTSTAVREVREETGVRIQLGSPLDTVHYKVNGGNKEVRFWVGTMLEATPRPPDHEVDVVKWLPIKAALVRLSHQQDHQLLPQYCEQPRTTTLILVRHGKAMDRKDWSRKDDARPISSRGRRQADQLVPMLAAYGVRSVISSSAVRCVATVRPYATTQGLTVEQYDELTEKQGTNHPGAVIALVQRLQQAALAEQTPTAICVHRPVLPAVLEALGLAPTTLSTGEMLVAHLTDEGDVHAIEHHRPQR